MSASRQDWIDFINGENNLYEWSDQLNEYVHVAPDTEQ